MQSGNGSLALKPSTQHRKEWTVDGWAFYHRSLQRWPLVSAHTNPSLLSPYHIGGGRVGYPLGRSSRMLSPCGEVVLWLIVKGAVGALLSSYTYSLRKKALWCVKLSLSQYKQSPSQERGAHSV